MNKVEFSAYNAFPVLVETMDFLQSMIKVVAELSKIGGSTENKKVKFFGKSHLY